MSDGDKIPPTEEALDEVGGRALVEAWRSSGLSGAAFCRRNKLRVQRLHYWRERLGYPIRVLKDHRATPMPPEPAPAVGGFVQVLVGPSPRTPSSHVDIVVGDAVIRVRPGFDAVLLREVVRAMAAAGSAC
jgi:hypothetical protein